MDRGAPDRCRVYLITPERFDPKPFADRLARVDSALAEVRRVLKPQGQFLFLEHGRHPDAKVSRWQDRLNGIWGKVFDGCNINRDMPKLIADSGLVTTALENEVQAEHDREHRHGRTQQPRKVGEDTHARRVV